MNLQILKDALNQSVNRIISGETPINIHLLPLIDQGS